MWPRWAAQCVRQIPTDREPRPCGRVVNGVSKAMARGNERGGDAVGWPDQLYSLPSGAGATGLRSLATCCSYSPLSTVSPISSVPPLPSLWSISLCLRMVRSGTARRVSARVCGAYPPILVLADRLAVLGSSDVAGRILAKEWGSRVVVGLVRISTDGESTSSCLKRLAYCRSAAASDISPH